MTVPASSCRRRAWSHTQVARATSQAPARQGGREMEPARSAFAQQRSASTVPARLTPSASSPPVPGCCARRQMCPRRIAWTGQRMREMIRMSPVPNLRLAPSRLGQKPPNVSPDASPRCHASLSSKTRTPAGDAPGTASRANQADRALGRVGRRTRGTQRPRASAFSFALQIRRSGIAGAPPSSREDPLPSATRSLPCPPNDPTSSAVGGNVPRRC